MSYPTNPVFIAFLDANPTRYKNTPEADGYNATQDIANEITDRKMIPNPVPQGDVPKPLTITDLQALISEDSTGRLSDSWWNQMRVNLSGETSENGITGTREDAVAQVNVAFERNNITESEATILSDEINSVIPDPDWPSEVQDLADCQKEWGLGGMSTSYVNNALGRV